MISTINLLKSKVFYNKLPYSEDFILNLLKSPLRADNIVPCVFMHDNSCSGHYLKRLFRMSKFLANFYFIAHAFPYVVFKRSELRKHPIKTLLGVLKTTFISILSVAGCIAGGNFGFCGCKNLASGIKPLSTFIGYIFFSTSIFIEQRKRVEEISIYFFPRFFEVFLRMLKKHLVDRKNAPLKFLENLSIPYYELIFFGFG